LFNGLLHRFGITVILATAIAIATVTLLMIARADPCERVPETIPSNAEITKLIQLPSFIAISILPVTG
jgi:hypothetical protein